MSGLRVVWQQGGEAHVQSVQGVAITLLSTVSSPPGTPQAGSMPSGTALQVKVHSCKRQAGEPAMFLIAGRVINASRVVLAEVGAPASEN